MNKKIRRIDTPHKTQRIEKTTKLRKPVMSEISETCTETSSIVNSIVTGNSRFISLPNVSSSIPSPIHLFLPRLLIKHRNLIHISNHY